MSIFIKVLLIVLIICIIVIILKYTDYRRLVKNIRTTYSQSVKLKFSSFLDFFSINEDDYHLYKRSVKRSIDLYKCIVIYFSFIDTYRYHLWLLKRSHKIAKEAILRKEAKDMEAFIEVIKKDIEAMDQPQD